MTSKKLLKILKKNGWKEVSQKGSHKKLVKDGMSPIILPMHNRDIDIGLLEAILKCANLR